jgi:hypothetical protein
MAKINCKNKILEFFHRTKFVTNAYNLKKHKDFQHYSILTIKKNLTELKKEGYLTIMFRTIGRTSNEIGLTGEYRNYKGKTYYKLIEK